MRMSNRVSWEDHHGEVIDNVDEFDIIDCRTCEFKHIVPIPTEDELEEVYRQEYYAQEKPLYLERHLEDLDWWELVYKERYEQLEEHLPADSRRILDIGSGLGFFLEFGDTRGWSGLGIEPAEEAANHAQELGVDVVQEFFDEELSHTLGTFDVVHMAEILEHVPDPTRALQLARGLLDRGGLVSVIVPNDYNPFQETLRTECGYDPWWVAPPHHINYFDFESLGQLLDHTGFRVIHRTTSFPMSLFLLMGDNYVGDEALGRRCHSKRKEFEKNLDAAGLNSLKRAAYGSLAELGIGREVVLIGEKKK